MYSASALRSFASRLCGRRPAPPRRLRQDAGLAPAASEVLEQRLLLTFGVNGVALADVTPAGDWIEGIALQQDGKIVVAGNVGVARFNADGSLDTTFNSGGLVPGFVRNGAEYFNDVAIQADGKIVVVGRTYVAGSDFLLHRYLPNGTLDPTFGTNGVVVTDLAKGKTDEAKSVAVQADGKIVVVGSSGSSWANASQWTVVRYNANGTLDKTFNKSGVVTGFARGSDAESADGVVVQGGKILVAGSAYGSGSAGSNFALARYNADGSLDKTFGGAGQVQTDFASDNSGVGSHDNAYALALAPDGKIVAVGRTSGGKVALARYSANGALDATLDGDGKVVATASPIYRFWSVAVQADGKIVAAGGDAIFAAARFNVNGTLDTSFSAGYFDYLNDGWAPDEVDGWLLLPAATESFGRDMLLLPDGRILLAGAGGETPENVGFALVRLTPDGSLDAPPTITDGGATAATASIDPAAASTADEDDALLALVYDDDEEELLLHASGV